jgi:type IV pilus assembly protein PilN
MIKVNLLPIKRKKKAKPLPAFLIVTVIVTVIVCIIMGYLSFFFASRLSARKETFANNEKRIAELKEKIKAVEDFEQRNKTFKQRNDIIEELSKNKSIPVKILDEISSLLPTGVWLQSLVVTASGISMEGYGFTNPDIVIFVDHLKASTMFTDVYLQESRSVEIEKVPAYMFKLSFKLKV